MDKEKLAMDYPNDQEMKAHIQSIVSLGLPKRKSFPKYLTEMYQHLGFRYLFRDSTELVFVLFLALCVLGLGIRSIESSIKPEDLYSIIFILSPVLYFVVASVFLVNAFAKDTFDVEMTCKYHVFQLAAFRMLVFSVITLIANIFLVIIVSSLFKSINLLEALLLSCSSLSIFSVLYLYVLQKVKYKYSTYVMMAGWILVNVLPAIFNQDIYSIFLNAVPLYVYAVVFAASLAIYVNRLKKFITFRNVEGVL